MKNSIKWQERQIKRLRLLAQEIEKNAPESWKTDGSLIDIIEAIKLLQTTICIITRKDLLADDAKDRRVKVGT